MAQLLIVTDAGAATALVCHVVERAAVADVIANTDVAVAPGRRPNYRDLCRQRRDFSALQFQIMIET
jgi:hypothetical protein